MRKVSSFFVSGSILIWLWYHRVSVSGLRETKYDGSAALQTELTYQKKFIDEFVSCVLLAFALFVDPEIHNE
jgi:hypothetical protein